MKYTLLKEQLALKLGITLHPGKGTVEKDHITLTAGSRFKQPEVVPPGSLVLESWYKDAGFTMIANDNDRVDITFSNLYANFVELDDAAIFQTTQTSDVSISKIQLDSRYAKFYIDWGDGKVDTVKNTLTDVTHNYAASGKYTIKISKHVNQISITNNSGRASKIENIVQFSSNVTALPDYFAYHQSTLRSVNLAGIQTIGIWAFEDCSSATFTNYNSVRSFGDGTFNRCNAITQFTVPSVTTSIGRDRWITSNSLTSLTVDPANTTFVDIGNIIYRPSDRKLYGACKSANFDFTTYDVRIDRLNLALKTLNISNKDIILPASLTGLDSYEFENVVAKSIDMSNCTSITSIGSSQYTFNNTTLSESFTLPPNITSIGRYTFNNVKGNGFGTIIFPPSFRKLQDYWNFYYPSSGAIKKIIFQNSEFDMSTNVDHPFNRCNELTEISLEAMVDPAKIPPMSTSFFEADVFSNNLVIYVANEEMKTAFENATNWNKYAGRYQIRG